MKTFVIGDIHGNIKALKQCLKKSNIDYKNDELIILGDVCDGWPFVKECIDELIKIANCIFILGNHDEWFLQYCRYGLTPDVWLKQGGRATLKSFENVELDKYIKFLNDYRLLYVDYNRRVFVHGGIDLKKIKTPQTRDYVLWDRSLYKDAVKFKRCKTSPYKEIFIGHTETEDSLPFNVNGLWNIDTGSGWSGKLTIMDVNTKEYWQSDDVKKLYRENNSKKYFEKKFKKTY
jgi:serine/threonine protein phosphatase 1